MPKGVEKKSKKRPAFRFVFEDFLVTKLQAQYRIVTEPCGPLLTGMGTVAGRPKAIGYYEMLDLDPLCKINDL